MHDVSGQAKVTDLHNFPLCQEDIAGSQVPVDTLCRKGKNNAKVNPSAAGQPHAYKTGHLLHGETWSYLAHLREATLA